MAQFALRHGLFVFGGFIYPCFCFLPTLIDYLKKKKKTHTTDAFLVTKKKPQKTPPKKKKPWTNAEQ